MAYATGTPPPGLPQKCTCSKELSLEHVLSCNPSRTLARHNMLQARLVGFAREQGVATSQNVRQTIDEGRRVEPDIIFLFPGRPLETDVTVVNPCCPTNRFFTLSKPLHAIHVAERTKKRKYEDQARARGHDFVPLAFGTHGGMADDVGNLLRKLAMGHRDRHGA